MVPAVARRLESNARADSCLLRVQSVTKNRHTPVRRVDQASKEVVPLVAVRERRGPESNRRIAVLQTAALPLGYRANNWSYINLPMLLSLLHRWPETHSRQDAADRA